MAANGSKWLQIVDLPIEEAFSEPSAEPFADPSALDDADASRIWNIAKTSMICMGFDVFPCIWPDFRT